MLLAGGPGMLRDPTDWVRPSLRPYQSHALENWLSSRKRGVVCLPNARRFAIAALASLRSSAVILCADRAVADEWGRTLPRWYSGGVGFAVDEARVESVTVTTFDRARHELRHFGRPFDLLVVDGVDRLSPALVGDLASTTLPGARLGLAERTLEGSPGHDLAASLVGPVLCEASTVPSGSRESVRLWVEFDSEERARYADLHRQGAIAGFRSAARLAAFPRAKRALLASLLRDHRSDRTYVFAGFADAARTIAEDVGIPAIDSDLPNRKRDAIVAAFRADAFRAVVCAHGLAGIADPPQANVVISVPGALGEGAHRQSMFSVLRSRPGRPFVAYELVTGQTLDDRPSTGRQGKGTEWTTIGSFPV